MSGKRESPMIRRGGNEIEVETEIEIEAFSGCTAGLRAEVRANGQGLEP